MTVFAGYEIWKQKPRIGPGISLEIDYSPCGVVDNDDDNASVGKCWIHFGPRPSVAFDTIVRQPACEIRSGRMTIKGSGRYVVYVYIIYPVVVINWVSRKERNATVPGTHHGAHNDLTVFFPFFFFTPWANIGSYSGTCFTQLMSLISFVKRHRPLTI